MEALTETVWDVVIAGTGLQQSLLALALSRSGRKVLHVDRNEYYGGHEAAFSLQEAETWVKRLDQGQNIAHCVPSTVPQLVDTDTEPDSAYFQDTSIVQYSHSTTEGDLKLSSSREYNLSLSPSLIYNRSRLIPLLVSSKVHEHLDFQALGSWWLLQPTVRVGPSGLELCKVPNGREDVFADSSTDLRSARSLMKFLKFISAFETKTEIWSPYADKSFSEFLSTQFGLPQPIRATLQALATASVSPSQTTTSFALPRVARHMRSIGLFGPGYGVVIPKWGGLAELSQVACRAGAVGGGVYMLGKGIKSISSHPYGHVDLATAGQNLDVELEGGETVEAKWLVGADDDVPSPWSVSSMASMTEKLPASLRSTYVVSSKLQSLFPLSVEGAIPPAGAMVIMSSSSIFNPDRSRTWDNSPPIYIIVHGSETGDCPKGQSVLYVSMSQIANADHSVLDRAVETLLATLKEKPLPKVLWTLRYTLTNPLDKDAAASAEAEPVDAALAKMVVVLPPSNFDVAVDDSALDRVKEIWRRILESFGEEVEDEEFLNFPQPDSNAYDAGDSD